MSPSVSSQQPQKLVDKLERKEEGRAIVNKNNNKEPVRGGNVKDPANVCRMGADVRS